MDKIHVEHPLMPTEDYNKVLDAVHSLTNPMHETDVHKSITVGPPLPRQPDGSLYMSDLPKDGKFYQNMIYRDGDDRFMVDAQGNRISVDDMFNKKGK